MSIQEREGIFESSERIEMGRALRDAVPRVSHADYRVANNYDRDSVAILERSNQGRMPELVPIRYGRMLTNPFAYFRGSAALMAYDLSTTPVSGIRVQACGDCHLSNFGLFATPERNLVFDLNDFDETLPAPWEWDIKRLAASFAVAVRNEGHTDSTIKTIVADLVSAYRTQLRTYAGMRVLDVWYSRLDDQQLLKNAPNDEALLYRKRVVAKARSSLGEYLFPKVTAVKDGHRQIVDQPPLVFHFPGNIDEKARLKKMEAEYKDTLPAHLRKLFEHYYLEDVAFKVVGVGSVGTRCFIMLYLAGSDDPLLLQAKEARTSVLEEYAGKSRYKHCGERVVVGQRLMQSASDMFLGWTTSDQGFHYYIRQLRDMKFSVRVENFTGEQIARYAEVCGWALARAHAKGGDAAMISGYLGKSDEFDQALVKFALAYADQTEMDYAELVKAVKTGRLQPITGK